MVAQCIPREDYTVCKKVLSELMLCNVRFRILKLLIVTSREVSSTILKCHQTFITLYDTLGVYMKLEYQYTPKTEIGRNSFGNRVVIPWNKLPENVVYSTNALTFKRNYDKYIRSLN